MSFFPACSCARCRELKDELKTVVNAFDPWSRERGKYYTLDWKPQPARRAIRRSGNGLRYGGA